MPRRQRETLAEYVATRCDDIYALGGEVLTLTTNDVGDEVVIHGVIRVGREGHLVVFEAVREQDSGSVTRRKYSYHASWRSDLLFRYDRDPVAHPEMPEHKHIGKSRVPWDAVSLRDVTDELWDLVLQREADP